MNTKYFLDKIRQNNQEGSMTLKFLTWRNKDKRKCIKCGQNLIDEEFTQTLCWDCFYKKIQSKGKVK